MRLLGAPACGFRERRRIGPGVRSGKSHKHWARTRPAQPRHPFPAGWLACKVKRFEHGSAVFRSQAHSQVLRQDPRSRGNAEPHRGAEVELRPVPELRRPGPCRTDGEGIKGTFQSVFPIKDFNETAVLEFVKYELEPPKYDVDECMQRDMTYAAPLKVTLRLIVFEVDEETGARSVKDIKEQDVYMGDMPLMTPNGTFIVNGTERVIVSQMHRSPGRVLRPRQGQDPLLGQAALHQPRHPLPRLVARLRVRRQGHRLRPHRPPPQAAGDDAALCPRHGPGRDHGGLLRHRDLPEGRQRLGDPLLPRAAARHQAEP